MRGLLTGGVKAILAIAALSTAAHWALRVQREPAPIATTVASLPDPVTTGSIEPLRIERGAPAPQTAKPSDLGKTAGIAKTAGIDRTSDLDQGHLSALIASTTGGAKPKAAAIPAQKPVVKR